MSYTVLKLQSLPGMTCAHLSVDPSHIHESNFKGSSVQSWGDYTVAIFRLKRGTLDKLALSCTNDVSSGTATPVWSMDA